MLQQFFIFCSGADTDILNDCPKSEYNKYVGMGATVFFTAVMAFIAASFALYTVFDNTLIAIAFGLVWGMLIFNLDRFIVSTIRKTGSIRNELLQALPRLILAIIIAITISKPLELKIFEKEIDQVLLEEKNAMTLANKDQIALQYTPEIENRQAEIGRLKNEVISKEVEVNELYDTYIGEAEGTSGTFKLGKGPVYKEKREKHDTALAELQSLREANAQKIEALETQIAELDTTFKTKLTETQPVIDGFDGLMARINALKKLPWLPSFFIFLLFLTIETAPIVSKLMSPIGPYDTKLSEIENTTEEWVAQKKYQRGRVRETDTAINDKIYTDIAEEEELYAYKKQKARELLKLQADAFYEHQKKHLKLIWVWVLYQQDLGSIVSSYEFYNY